MIQTVVLSSLHRVFPQICPEDKKITRITTLKDEPVSFQVAFKLSDEKLTKQAFNIAVDSKADLSCYLVSYVPVLHTHIADYDDIPAPGLYPDMLLPKVVDFEITEQGYNPIKHTKEQAKYEDTHLFATDDSWQSLWITFNEQKKSLNAGVYRVQLDLVDLKANDKLGSAEIEIEVINASLSKQKFIYTNWFYCDCLSQFYKEEMFSDRFFEIVENYLKVAAKNGMNMVLTPTFTPALDTPVGEERQTAQLVKITKTDSGYEFDFSLLKRFIDVCKKAGIEYFEHAHLFSQWGAKYCPKIMATVNGKEKQIFGWHVKADSKKYRKFLEAYLPAVCEFFDSQGLRKKVLFHISDEPNNNNIEVYKKAVKTVGNLLDGYMCGDALSHYAFYERGIVKMPIVCTHALNDFVGKCKNFWAYYTGGEIGGGLSNRLIVNNPENNRMMGIQMYYMGASGFLHWGYNCYFDRMSKGLFDPKVTPGGYSMHPGTSYCVYPSYDGRAIQSPRQKVFGEGINDIKALKCYENLYGRSAAKSLIEKHFGVVTAYTCPSNPEQLLSFRAELNNLIAKAK